MLVVVAAITCLVLGWWQWSRFQAAGGTFQNLGYALQWPLFAGFCVYAYRRFVRLEQESGQGVTPTRASRVTEIPHGVLPPRPPARVRTVDDELAEYNRYLAELNARDENRNPE